MNSTNTMNPNNSTTNLECDLTIDEQPMPPPPPPSGIKNKDEEIEELKQVVVKLQEQVKDCEMKLEKANARITERNTNPKEVCITELTHYTQMEKQIKYKQMKICTNTIGNTSTVQLVLSVQSSTI